jgi:hypothetical protein
MNHVVTTQQQGILGALRTSGWEFERTVALHEWWAGEVWLMRSVWSPQDSHFYLTFLVDPQADHQRRAGKSAWAAKASACLPQRWQQGDGEFTFSLGHGWAGQVGRLNYRCLPVQKASWHLTPLGAKAKARTLQTRCKAEEMGKRGGSCCKPLSFLAEQRRSLSNLEDAQKWFVSL